MKKIVQQENKVLRDIAKEVKESDIGSAQISALISDMHATLSTQKDGVALAAPQIGKSLRIFVVSPLIFKNPQEETLVYINPEIVRYSKKTKWLNEGCLSCRWKIGEVERSLELTVRAFDEHGEYFEEQAEGFLAHVIQHETDHLNGILFIDKARKLRDMTQKEIDEAQGF